jgi:hypothetical protein
VKVLIAGGMALFLSMAAAASAQAADCAVSGLNGKVVASAAEVDTGSTDEVYNITAAVAAPLGCRFGFQADVAEIFSNSASRTFAAGHLFTRDPSRYLLGVTGGWLDGGSGSNLTYAAVEAELYTDKWTFTALAGGGNLPGTVDSDIYGLTVAYYWTDNLKFSAGDLRAFGQDLVNVRAEWQPEGSSLAFFADVADDVGSVKLTTFKLGAKFHFGAGAKSLKERNRHDDPEPIAGTFGEWYNLSAAQIGILSGGGLGPNGLPVPVNGVCPTGFFYVPSMSTTECYI